MVGMAGNEAMLKAVGALMIRTWWCARQVVLGKKIGDLPKAPVILQV
jgi:hypothetical protein